MTLPKLRGGGDPRHYKQNYTAVRLFRNTTVKYVPFVSIPAAVYHPILSHCDVGGYND